MSSAARSSARPREGRQADANPRADPRDRTDGGAPDRSALGPDAHAGTGLHADELEGRRYELERGLAEPLVVIDNGGTLLLADGHHRVLAADRLGIDEMDAYVIVIDTEIDLGMARTAEKEGLERIDDIDVVDYARHPLVQTTKRLQSEGGEGRETE